MILEAFSKVLHEERARTGDSAENILHDWLQDQLACYDAELDNVTRVIQTEVAMLNISGQIVFTGRSTTGQTLLDSLYLYCDSYEQWQFRRWLHHAKPHSFASQG